MVEYKSRFHSFAPDLDGFDDELTDTIARPAPYRFGRDTPEDTTAETSVPLFLSDPDGEPQPDEFYSPARKSRLESVSSKILVAVVAASGAAMLFAWFSSDAMRAIIVDAKASIASSLLTSSTTAQADAAQLTPGDLQLAVPGRAAGPQIRQQAAAPAPTVIANAGPSREDIATAYQHALRGPVATTPLPAAPQAAAPAPEATPQATPPHPAMSTAPLSEAKRIDAQQLAVLMKRAKDMLALGDIPAARLLLERAAEGKDADAALLLARTYDPAVLGTSDVRNITPEPDQARSWYRTAAQLGSAEAQQRLAQLTN